MTWKRADDVLIEHLLPQDEVLEKTVEASERAGLPAIAVSPLQGKFLQLLASVTGATRILEIGTLGGYSTIWLARVLPPGGQLVTLEIDPHHADVAEANLRHAGLFDRVRLMRGDALSSLKDLDRAGEMPFDFVFIDADKERCADYFDWSVRHTRAGGVIVVDNVVREGAIAERESADPRVQGVRRLLAQIKGDRRVEATALQTVGMKGYDGCAIARVLAPG